MSLSPLSKIPSLEADALLIISCWHMKLTCLLGKKKGTKNGFGVSKIDMSKAYDRVNWVFLKVVLVSMNFPSKWVNWTLECISSV